MQAFDLAEERAQLWVELGSCEGLLEVEGGWVNEARLHERIRFANAANREVWNELRLREDCISDEAVEACDTRWCTMEAHVRD